MKYKIVKAIAMGKIGVDKKESEEEVSKEEES